MTYEVRGPDPDDDWFVIQIDGDEETTLDEAFDTEAAAQAAADRLNAAPRQSGGVGGLT